MSHSARRLIGCIALLALLASLMELGSWSERVQAQGAKKTKTSKTKKPAKVESVEEPSETPAEEPSTPAKKPSFKVVKPEGDAPDTHTEERAAIRETMQSFVKAFESRDAKLLASHWTSEGEFQNDQGIEVQGRENLQAAFAGLFAKTPEITASVEPRGLKFLSDGLAIDEGVVSVKRGPTEPAKKAKFNALFVQEESAWRIARLVETPYDEVSVSDLDWLIGEWRSEVGEGAEIRTVYRWDENKKFIHARFTIKEKEIALSGSQVIGVDPETGNIHSWTFEANGGVGEAEWLADDNRWVLTVDGTTTDGRSLTETNILCPINRDTFTWQSTNRQFDGEELADLPPVKVTRVKVPE